MANPPLDQGIPLLTEVIDPQSNAEAAPTPAPAPARPAASAAASAASTAPVPPSTTPTPVAADIVNLSPAPMPRPATAPATTSVSAPPHFGLNPSLASAAPSLTAESAASPTRGVMPGVPSQSAAAAATPASLRTEVAPAEKVGSADSAVPAGTWTDTELRDLENELRLRITRQVLGRIDFVLDHRVRNSVTEVVDAAIDALAVEIKRGLHETLTDIVARAVAQEISRLQSGKK